MARTLVRKQATWLLELEKHVSSLLGGIQVVGIAEIETEDSGELEIKALVRDSEGSQYVVKVKGSLYASLPQASAPEIQTLALPDVVAEQVFESVEQAQAWAVEKGAFFVQPLIPGARTLLEKQGEQVKLVSQGVDLAKTFPQLVDSIGKMQDNFAAEAVLSLEADGRFLEEGELVSIQADSSLQPTVTLVDLLQYCGKDVRDLNAGMRQQMLQEMLAHADEPVLHGSASLVIKQTEPFIDVLSKFYEEHPRAVGIQLKSLQAPYGEVAKQARIRKVRPVELGIYKSDAAERLVYGVVLRPNYIDAQDDVMTPEEVRKAAHYYMEHAQVILLRHGKDPVQGDKPIKAVPLECYIAPVDFKLGTGQVLKGDWVMCVRVDDLDMWEQVESGEYRGFSVGGVGVRSDG